MVEYNITPLGVKELIILKDNFSKGKGDVRLLDKPYPHIEFAVLVPDYHGDGKNASFRMKVYGSKELRLELHCIKDRLHAGTRIEATVSLRENSGPQNGRYKALILDWKRDDVQFDIVKLDENRNVVARYDQLANEGPEIPAPSVASKEEKSTEVPPVQERTEEPASPEVAAEVESTPKPVIVGYRACPFTGARTPIYGEPAQAAA